VAAGWAPFPAGQETSTQTGDTLTLSVQASGSIDVVKRESDNFDMAIEDWTIAMTFSQPTQFTMIRKAGKIGGAPAGLFQMIVASGESLFQPIPSPFDAITQNLTGQIKVSKCVSRTFPLSKGMKTPKAAQGIVSIPLESLGMVDKGTLFVQGCSTNPDKVLVFYLPPPGFYNAPKRGPIKCNEDYTYEQDESPGVLYDSSLLEASYATESKAACESYRAENTESLAFVGSASWRGLAGGATVTLQKSYTGTDGQQANMSEPFSKITLSLTVVLQKS